MTRSRDYGVTVSRKVPAWVAFASNSPTRTLQAGMKDVVERLSVC